MKYARAFSGLSAVVLTGALAVPAFAQQSSPASSPDQSQKQDATDTSTYATGQPLENQSKEGFWGHVNPFARKKWVHRQIDPVKDRVNELDQLQAKNANDIRDVDSRATAGINKAQSAADLADQHALDAGNRADKANQVASTATTRTEALHGTVKNLDQYDKVTDAAIPFAKGSTALGPKGKAELDAMAEKLATEKGYILDVQGFSGNGVATSQAMADSVVRYLVTEHQVPVYRIYKSGLGRNTAKAAEGEEKPVRNGVRVALLHNSLASMDSQAAPATSMAGTSTPEPSAR
ncbi:OmpA family protein [Terriglobus tenax]|uniref:OmpA family protein n=1 Tax=Terriglobus tenax TaxID=1111115 RepID=UPI0021DF7583|nr:OmpA family protein [Terriglobus tenax]